MNQPKQYYCYAIDKDGVLTNVHNAVKGREYFCPYCNSPMIPRQGAIRKWHFAHKPDSSFPCNYESYLHKLAKLQMKNSFDNSKQFFITFRQKFICSVDDCPINFKEKCTWYDYKSYDLKEVYDTCSIEKGINGFIADLILSDSTKQDKSPILVEICVSHKSTIEKINSGLRIIEIKIESEEDISGIIGSNEISQIGSDYIDFYNFKMRSVLPPLKHQPNKFTLWIDNAKKIHQNNGHPLGCLSRVPIETNDILFRIDAGFPINYEFAFAQIAKTSINLRYCYMCKFYKFVKQEGTNICVFHRYSPLYKFPNVAEANTCSHYSVKEYKHNLYYNDTEGFKIYGKSQN